MNKNADQMSMQEALLSGVTPEDLLAQFQEQLKTAQKNADEIKRKKEAAESAKEKDLKVSRAKLVDVLIEYLTTLGIIDVKEVDADLKAALVEAVEESEQRLKAFSEIHKILAVDSPFAKQGKSHGNLKMSKSEKSDEDKVLREFLAHLAEEM